MRCEAVIIMRTVNALGLRGRRLALINDHLKTANNSKQVNVKNVGLLAHLRPMNIISM